MGIYAAVLHALGNMDPDLLMITKDDQFGRQLQDMNLLTRKRASRSRARTADAGEKKTARGSHARNAAGQENGGE